MGRASLALVLLVGCAMSTPADPRGGSPEGDGDGDLDGDVDGDSDADGDGGRDGIVEDDRGGAATYLVTGAEVSTDLLCDVDGDGEPDNSLHYGPTPWIPGPPPLEGWVYASWLTTAIAGYAEISARTFAHLPRVDDVRAMHDEEVVLILGDAVDLGDPEDRPDDSGAREPFYAGAGLLDPCGEPRHVFSSAALDGGRLTADDGSFPLPIEGRPGSVAATAFGELPGREEHGELVLCGFFRAEALHEQPFPDGGGTLGELTLFEAFVANGSVFGLASAPGPIPDRDLDGDGLERFEVGDDGRIERCVDGDGTIIEGRDCVRSEEIADAYGFVLRLSLTRALFLDREPGWEREVRGTCDAPPTESLWDAR